MTEDKSKCRSWFDAHGARHGHHGINNQELITNYDNLADKYDQFYLAPDMKCAGYNIIPQTMSELFPSNRGDVSVLDLGAGTGNVGLLMKDKGFTKLDAFEPSTGMLEIARKKNIYGQMYNAFLNDEPLDIPNDTYDAIIMQAVIGPGTVPCVAFEELVRIVKPGGYIVMCNRSSYLEEIPDYKENWTPFVARLEREGRWSVVRQERYPNQFMEHEGLHMVFKIC
ncbi:methyltransferase-like protein 27 [Littorina saxatilis]|uniref:Uncharacterized protein n=1 Tax=Littorina saxatilis TaxID=31220 RepID=A0AAN9AYA9_9CAEN